KIRKIAKKAGPGGVRSTLNTNPKFREKAAKIVQGWWREKKERLKKLLDKIILIQSVWRGTWLRKYVYEIIYLSFLHQRSCNILSKVLVNHVRPIVFDELFAENKWAKEYFGNLLMERDERYTLLRIKPYFEKWRYITDWLKKRNWRSKKLVDKRELDEDNLNNWKKYFNTWRLKSDWDRYISKSKNQEEQKRKFFATLDLINGAQKLGKRTGLKTTKPPLEDYLAKKMRDKAIKNWTLHRGPKNSLIMLRKYFNKWKDITQKMLMKDFKNWVFHNMCNRIDNRMDKTKMRRCFNIWRSKIPRDTYLDYTDGCTKLKNFTHRRTHKDPLEAWRKKIVYESEKEGIMRMLGIKSRNIKYHWREYFYKWRSQIQKSKDKEIQNDLYKTLLNTMFNKRKNRILFNRFNQWRKTPKIDLEALFDRYKKMNDMVKRTVNHVNKPTKKDFFERLKKTISPSTYKSVCKKWMQKYLQGDKRNIRTYFYKWREQNKNLEIYDWKKQWFKYLLGENDNKNRKSRLAKTMSKWKWFVWMGRNDDHSKRLRNIYLGLDKLQTLYIGREVEIMIRLHRLLNTDHRPKFLKNVINRLFKPRATVRDCFNKWRRFNDWENAHDAEKGYKSKVLRSKAKKIDDRQRRDTLLKSYFKWKNLCRNPEDYYPKIKQGVDTCSNLLKKNQCKTPFNKLKTSKNYSRRIIPLLKHNGNLQKKLNNDALKNKFNHWKDGVNKNHIKDLKTNIVLKTKGNMWTNEKKKWLSKNFQRWKLFRPKKLDSNFYKGWMKVQYFCERPFVKTITKACKDKIETHQKKEGLHALMGTSKTFRDKLLHKDLLKWWKNSTLTDPNKSNKIKTRMRLLFKKHEQIPINKSFHRWVRALAKNPDFSNIIKGTDKLKKGGILKNKVPFDKLKNYIAPKFIHKKILKNLWPNSKVAKNRSLRNAFDKWKGGVNKINIQALRGGWLGKWYGKEKTALRERFWRKYFKKWSYKEPEKKPMDLYNVIQANESIHSMLSKRYLKDLFKNMNDYGKKKFLRSIWLGTPKYHIRRIKPYFNRWRTVGNKIASKQLAQEASSKFIARTKKYRQDEKVQKVFRSKFNQWKTTARDVTTKLNKNVPEADKHLKKHNIKQNAPPLLKNMKSLADKNKKKKALKSLPPKREKCEKNNLKKYYDKWKNQLHKMLLKDMANRLKFNQFKHLFKLFDNGVMKYFLWWKFKSQMKKSSTPYEIGIDKIRWSTVREPLKKFLKKADMINWEIPRGLSAQKALINNKRNLAKSIQLRNISLRPYFNKWKKQSEALTKRDQRHKIISLVTSPICRNTDKMSLKSTFNHWKSKCHDIKAKDKWKETEMKIMTMLSSKNSKIFIKKYFNKWRNNTDTYNKQLKSMENGCNKLRAHADRNIVNNMRKVIVKQAKFEKVKTMLYNTFRNNDKGNLASSFNKWKKSSQNLREYQLKTLLLRNLASKQDYKNDENSKNR
ncbi:MAG: hypothetical protein ACRC42_03155, partial [Mycoplasma sp.]